MDITLAFPAQLSQHLRSLRKSRGLSQTQLAVLLGVAQSRIASIEKDATKLSISQLQRLLAALDAELVLRTRDARAADAPAGRSHASPMEGQW